MNNFLLLSCCFLVLSSCQGENGVLHKMKNNIGIEFVSPASKEPKWAYDREPQDFSNLMKQKNLVNNIGSIQTYENSASEPAASSGNAPTKTNIVVNNIKTLHQHLILPCNSLRCDSSNLINQTSENTEETSPSVQKTTVSGFNDTKTEKFENATIQKNQTSENTEETTPSVQKTTVSGFNDTKTEKFENATIQKNQSKTAGLNDAKDGSNEDLKINFKNSIRALNTLFEEKYLNISCLIHSSNTVIQDAVLDSVNSFYTYFNWGIKFYTNLGNETAMIDFKEVTSKFNTTLKNLENLLKINNCRITKESNVNNKNLAHFRNIVRHVTNRTPALDYPVDVEKIFVDYLQIYDIIFQISGKPITKLVSLGLEEGEMIMDQFTSIHDHFQKYDDCLNNPNKFLNNSSGETGLVNVSSLALDKHLSCKCLQLSYDTTSE